MNNPWNSIVLTNTDEIVTIVFCDCGGMILNAALPDLEQVIGDKMPDTCPECESTVTKIEGFVTDATLNGLVFIRGESYTIDPTQN